MSSDKKSLKIAIHPRNEGLYQQWVNYCEKNNITYEFLDIRSNSVFNDISKYNVVLCDYNHEDHDISLISHSLIQILSSMGKITYPSIKDYYYFDDKIAQILLFRSNNIFHPSTYISFEYDDALNYIKDCKFPIVAKLRKGAGGINVFKLNNRKEAEVFALKSFNQGFKVYDKNRHLKDKIGKIKTGAKKKRSLIKLPLSYFRIESKQKLFPNERGYVFFQEYIKGLDCDYRIVVINGRKAFGAKRNTRPNDFRASGSGKAEYPKKQMPEKVVKTAFEVATKLESKCIAIDILYNASSNLTYTLEISHYYDPKSMIPCKGYWLRDLQWVEDNASPQYHLINDMVNEIPKS